MLEIRLFGQTQLFVDGAARVEVRARPVASLLGLLVLRCGQPVTRSWLAGTLWPDSSESQALLNLRIALMRLRDSLGPESDRVTSPDRQTLQLNVTGARLDVSEFDSYIMLGDELSLRSAVDVYSGALMESCEVEWISDERKRRAEEYVAARERLAEMAHSRGDHETALQDWRHAVAADWTSDSAQRGLMGALEAVGDTPAALLAYREFRVRLWDEMALDPDPATTTLYREIQECAKSGRRREPLTTDLPRSNRTEFRKSSGISGVGIHRASIPSPLTELLGRDAETRGVADAIRSNRLVTLVGAGGIGKTRLSIQVARDLQMEFPDCAGFVELAQLREGSPLVSHVALTLGLDTNSERPEGVAADIAARFAGRPALLVLDNCEHVLAVAASFTREILERCPLQHILATSRERLGVPGELIWRVPPLAFPEPGETNEARLNSPAVQLFVERAKYAQSGFSLADREDVEAVCTICRRLDGIPLAIELAAARVGPLTVQQISDRLDDRFRLLTRGNRAALPRHQTLRSLIDWSYDLLADEEKKLLRLLSLFVGGWTLEAAEAVFSEPIPYTDHRIPSTDPLDLLTSLTDRSLVSAESRAGATRYRMLETIREYAREALSAAGEDEEARRSHLKWAVDLAENAVGEVVGPQPDAALDRLQTEFDNIVASLAWAGTANSMSDLHLRLTAALWPFLLLRGHVPHGRNILRSAMDHENPPHSAAYAQTLLGAAILAYEQNAWSETETLSRESLEVFQVLGDDGGIAAALLHLGHVRLWHDDFAAAEDLLTECVDFYRAAGWEEGPAIAIIHLAAAAKRMGDARRGDSLLEEGMLLLRRADDLRTPFYGLSYLRNLARMVSQLAEARLLLDTCLRLAREGTGPRRVAVILRVLGDVAEHEGDRGFALSCHEEALEIHRATGNIYGVMYALMDIGNCCYRIGDYEKAIGAYRESMELFRKAGYRAGLDTACNCLGSALFHVGEPKEARKLHEEALAIFRERELVEGIAWSLERLAVVEARYGERDKASRLMEEAGLARAEFGRPMSPWDQTDWDEAESAFGGL